MDSQFRAGRTATPQALNACLTTAALPFLEGALLNPGLTPRHLLRVLCNPLATPGLIERVSRSPVWMKWQEVRAAIVLHARTPRAVAMNLISGLWWRDLARVVDRPALSALVRRSAESLLALRVRELALGERIALARIASRGVVRTLRRDESPMVLGALLQNPRLVEEDALAIARNPHAPAVVALHIVERLGTAGLADLAERPGVPPLVALAAQRRLDRVRLPSPLQEPGAALPC